MGLTELFILAVGLSMDAFAVSVCKGLSLGKIKTTHMCIAGAWFGGFQALMPLIGYFAGRFLSDFVTNYSHWIAFILLAIIGVSMIKESFGDEEQIDASMDVKSMFLLAVATSIDALMVGVTFAFFAGVGVGVDSTTTLSSFPPPKLHAVMTPERATVIAKSAINFLFFIVSSS